MAGYHPLDADEEWWRRPWVCDSCSAWFMVGDDPTNPVACPACGVPLDEETPTRLGECMRPEPGGER